MARTITIDPGKDLGEFVDNLVKSGRYKTASEAVREGLRLLQEGVANSKLQQLRELLDEGDNSPLVDGWNPDSFLNDMKRKHG